MQSAPGQTRLARWHAALNLQFIKKSGRTYLAKKSHVGPLVLQKTLHPEGDAVCHGIVIHPPGGVAGGDSLSLTAHVQEHGHAILTTPGAGKWYKANGQSASQHLEFAVAEHATLEWLPQENILFDGSEVKFSANVSLSEGAKFASWEILCFGRQAHSECWQSGAMHQKVSISRNGRLIWQECAHLRPQQLPMKSIIGLANNTVSASFVVAAGAVPTYLLEACKAIKPNLALELHARYGVTALPEIFCARYVGQSSQSARQYFEQLWQLLRPWYAEVEAHKPRIWNT